MKADLLADMLRATDQVRSGRLADATAMIRDALAGGGPAGRATPPSPAGRTASGAPAEPRRGLLRGRRLRRPLGDVLRTLAEGKRAFGGALGGAMEGGAAGLDPAVGRPEPEIPAEAQFLEDWHACAAGRRRYRLYVPGSLAGQRPEGLVVMLHGCRQNPEDFAVGTNMNVLAEAHRLVVVYPGQTGGDNSLGCWNWFRPGDQARGAGEPAILAGLTEALRDRFGVPQDRVFVAGLSAGGAMAAVLAEAYPDVYAAAGIHSGIAAGAAGDVVSAFAAMRGDAAPAGSSRQGTGDWTRDGTRDGPGPRLIVFHGAADRTVHPSNAERILARHGTGRGAGTGPVAVTHGTAAAGRAYTRMVAEAVPGRPAAECWIVDGAPHAWSGGNPGGSFTDPAGPDASAEMLRFFLQA